jgi:thiamine-phosphate pyrophosphorylase
VLVDGRASLAEFDALVDSLVEAEVGALQLRDKRLTDRQLMERARRLRENTHHTMTLAIINDRADLAQLVAADGVHVGQDDLAVKDARAMVGAQQLVGVSTHSLEQAGAAVLAGANYIGVGPTYPSTTKGFDAFGGLDLLREVAGGIRLPAFAIGGIGLENLEDVLRTGIMRVAVGAAIINAPDPAAVAREFIGKLNAG